MCAAPCVVEASVVSLFPPTAETYRALRGVRTKPLLCELRSCVGGGGTYGAGTYGEGSTGGGGLDSHGGVLDRVRKVRGFTV